MISDALHPASARRRHAALRKPCAAVPLGKPASRQRSPNQFPKLAALANALPDAVVGKVRWPDGVASRISWRLGWIGMTRVVPVLRWRSSIAPLRTY